jgi:TRAP-type C4-dicarboxylate transport system permease small subunit
MVRRGVTGLNKIFLWGASSVLFAMMLMAVANMILRPLKMPIQGTFELMGLGGALIVVLAAGAAQQSRIHIAVDILFMYFPNKLQWLLSTLSDVVCGGFFCLAAWQMGKYGMKLSTTGEISETLGVAVYPVVYVVALGLGGIGVTLFSQAFQSGEAK